MQQSRLSVLVISDPLVVLVLKKTAFLVESVELKQVRDCVESIRQFSRPEAILSALCIPQLILYSQPMLKVELCDLAQLIFL